MALEQWIAAVDREIQNVFRSSAACQRLAKIGGIGPLTSTALVAAVGDATEFRNGRHLAAWLGLVPRQHSSGGQQRLLGISKRGDCYLRSLFIHDFLAKQPGVERVPAITVSYRNQRTAG